MPQPIRKRGGQPGNQNARTYGLYAKNMGAAAAPAASAAPQPLDPLLLEILVLKTFMRRVVASASPADSLEQTASALRALVRAAYLLARIYTAHAPASVAALASSSVRQVDRDILAALARLDRSA